MCFRIKLLTLLFLFVLQPAYPQFIPKKVLADHVKSGLYLTVEEFNANAPSIPFGDLVPEDRDLLRLNAGELHLNCLSKLKYQNTKGDVSKIDSEKIWVIAIDGSLYIRHTMPETLILDEYCFYRILIFGAIGKYFLIKNKGGGWSPNPDIPAYIPERTVIKEYAVDFKTGKVFNFNDGFSKIKSIIKTDRDFAKEKITKDNLEEYIIAYNKKRPHPNASPAEVNEDIKQEDQNP